MDGLRETISNSEPLLLFLVIGIGFLLGQIRMRGFQLGVSGVLFVGLAFGAWHPSGTESFAIAHQVMQLGLILFVYTVGLSSGAGFFAALKTRGLRYNLSVILALTVGATLTLVVGRWMSLHLGQIVGVFCGGLTNTPALAAVTDLMSGGGVGDPRDPAVGYSMSYPFGILGGLIAFQLFQAIYRRADKQEKADAKIRSELATDITSADFEISNPELFDRPIGSLRIQDRTGTIISRHCHNDIQIVPTKYTVLHEGDVITAAGPAVAIAKAAEFYGTRSTEDLEHGDAGTITVRRILVSRKELSGKTMHDLQLDHHYGAQITRLRRADIDIVPDHYKTALQLGDRVRVVMPTAKAAEVAEFFGDSERSISELDYTALTLGISAGVLLGMIPIPLPGGSEVSLGFAGGPLVAGLVLGKLGRTGPLVWALPGESNQALRHIGLLFFLAAVGVMAGGRFFEALMSDGLQLIGLGIMTTSVTTIMALLLLRHYGKATVVDAIGATSGMQTQPATLARAYEMSKSDDTYIAYATTYPIAMVGKILIAQLLLIIGRLLM